MSVVFAVQASYIKRFCTIAEKMRLDTRIRMHRSRASGASNLSRYDRLCAVAKFIIAKIKVPQGRFQKKCHSEIKFAEYKNLPVYSLFSLCNVDFVSVVCSDV